MLDSASTNRIERLTAQLIADKQALSALEKIRRGIEKESLRIENRGQIAQTPHPSALGSALTHPNITTDYSEALLEFITPPFYNISSTLNFLYNLHTYTYSHIGDELLWVNSMPCRINSEQEIPIADYGTSNSGRMKHIYRIGLGHRYGRSMQTIAGIHYNVSLPSTYWLSYQSYKKEQGPIQPFINKHYFGLIRNFQRLSWLPVFLFGASPATCHSFIDNTNLSQRQGVIIPKTLSAVPTAAQHQAHQTLNLPEGTSLRMSPLGYQSSTQSELHVCYNSLNDYTHSLEHAIRTPHHAYEAIGVQADNNEYMQLNANVLQIENEFYNPIRPKRTSKAGERPTVSLREQGVEYIEIRLLDLDPFAPAGVTESTLSFIDILLLYCLFEESPLLCKEEQNAIDANLQSVVQHGRSSDLSLNLGKKSVPLKEAFTDMLPAFESIAHLLDSTDGSHRFTHALQDQVEKLKHPERLPSQKVLDTLKSNQLSFFEFGLQQARAQRDYFLNKRLPEPTRNIFSRTAQLSLTRQAQMESSPENTFEEYLANYFR